MVNKKLVSLFQKRKETEMKKTYKKLLITALIVSGGSISAKHDDSDFNPPKTFGRGLEHLGKGVVEVGTLGAANLEEDGEGNAFGNGVKNLGQGTVQVGSAGLINTDGKSCDHHKAGKRCEDRCDSQKCHGKKTKEHKDQKSMKKKHKKEVQDDNK